MTKIDWNKPLQLNMGGQWFDVQTDGTVTGYQDYPKVRNKPEPRYVWINVYSDEPLASINSHEHIARQAKSSNRPYLHTLKINIDTGETEKVYL